MSQFFRLFMIRQKVCYGCVRVSYRWHVYVRGAFLSSSTVKYMYVRVRVRVR